MLVKNWKQVYKSLAVWLPVVASTALVALEQSTQAGLVPDTLLPFVVGATAVIGWVVPQKSIKKGV